MKKIINKFYFILFLFLTVGVYGQLQNANWYFGDHAGLDFNTTPPTVLTDGQTGYSGAYTASVSDENGDLLFYTDGHSVWNKNHLKMQNGDNTLLGGNYTVVIVPFPNDVNKYYIFYSWGTQCTYCVDEGDQHACGATHYGYSVVNMTNGIGNVETLNVYIDAASYHTEDVHRYYAQKDHMSVTKHADGESYWLIINPFDYFFAYKIDEMGISPRVVSEDPWGSYYTGMQYETIGGGCNKMAISPNSEKIAYFNNSWTPHSDAGGVSIYLYNFDNENGWITPSNSAFLGEIFNGSSVEFSPNSNYLYGIGKGINNSVLQFDVNNFSSNPEVIYTQSSSNYWWMSLSIISLAKDGKIYIPGAENKHELSVINSPNSFGSSANFVVNQVDLLSGETLTLPQLIPFHESQCPTDLLITQDVLSGETDIQEASNTITATNTIFSGGTAEYDAGNFVLLDVGFKAEAGPITKTSYSHFYAYIDGCTGKVERDESSSANDNSSEDSQSRSMEEYTPIKLYPNPTKGVLTIESDSEVISWEIRSAFGDLKFTGGNTKQTIDTSNLPNGIYYLRGLLKDAKIFSRTFIKQ